MRLKVWTKTLQIDFCKFVNQERILMSEEKIELTHLTAQDSLVGIMLGAMISDNSVARRESDYIYFFVRHLPVFSGYDEKRIPALQELINGTIKVENGYTVYFRLVLRALEQEHHKLAYLLASVVTFSDQQFKFDEFGFLNLLKDELDIDPEIANKIKLVTQIYNDT